MKLKHNLLLLIFTVVNYHQLLSVKHGNEICVGHTHPVPSHTLFLSAHVSNVGVHKLLTVCLQFELFKFFFLCSQDYVIYFSIHIKSYLLRWD